MFTITIHYLNKSPVYICYLEIPGELLKDRQRNRHYKIMGVNFLSAYKEPYLILYKNIRLRFSVSTTRILPLQANDGLFKVLLRWRSYIHLFNRIWNIGNVRLIFGASNSNNFCKLHVYVIINRGQYSSCR